jgi:hypothetical protein
MPVINDNSDSQLDNKTESGIRAYNRILTRFANVPKLVRVLERVGEPLIGVIQAL